MKQDAKKQANPTTVALKKIVRSYGRIGLRGYRDEHNKQHPLFGSGSCATFDVEGSHDYGSPERAVLPVFGVIGNGHTDSTEERTSDTSKWSDYNDVYRPDRGYWSLYGSQDLLRDLLDLIPNHAEVMFVVKLDNLTTQGHVSKLFHGDALYLWATWGEGKNRKRREFLLDTCTGAHNTARFGNAKDV